MQTTPSYFRRSQCALGMQNIRLLVVRRWKMILWNDIPPSKLLSKVTCVHMKVAARVTEIACKLPYDMDITVSRRSRAGVTHLFTPHTRM